MEEETWEEETKTEEHLMMIILIMTITMNSDGKNVIPELQNKHVACCYGGWLVLRDKSTGDCLILNIFTMEKLQLPPLVDINSDHLQNPPDCIMSSSPTDTRKSCRIMFFERPLHKFRSCHLGDTEFTERELNNGGIIRNLVNYKGKLYALTSPDFGLFASDFSDTDLPFKQVVSGSNSLRHLIDSCSYVMDIYLVESCQDLLLILMGGYDDEVSDVYIFKADLSIGEWVELETLGDRAIFLDIFYSFSFPASAIGLKGNAMYWARNPFGRYYHGEPPPLRYLYMYDIEDKSISSLSWLSFPITTCNEEQEQEDTSSLLFEATNFCLQQWKDLQIEKLRKPQKKEESGTIGGSTILAGKKTLWADVPNDLLLEILPRLFAGDRVAFRSVCRSWYSVSPPSITSQQQLVLPLTEDSSSSPFLMCPGRKAYHPICSELYSMFPDMPGAKVRAARDGGWLLMDGLVFFNPLTTATIELPRCNAYYYRSLYFSAPPTSADCLVVVAAMKPDQTRLICFMKCGGAGWTYHEISEEEYESFCFSSCNPVVHNGLYYFLGVHANLLVFDPDQDQIRIIDSPDFISRYLDKAAWGRQQYMLEGDDGELIAVFVGADGNQVYTCRLNVSTSKWEILESLGNRMLFVSRPLSLCRRATISGSGNKIYFPRVVDDGGSGSGHILFYSLATRRYHTFEMGTSYSNFCGSKFYPRYNGWFMP